MSKEFKKFIKTTKVKILNDKNKGNKNKQEKLTDEEKDKNKTIYSILRDIQYEVWKIRNVAMTSVWDWQQFAFSYHERFGKYPKDKDVTGKSLKADIYGKTKEMGEFISSHFVNTATNEPIDLFTSSKKDILNGNKSIPSYRRESSFSIRKAQINNFKRKKGYIYTADLTLFSQKGKKRYGKDNPYTVKLKSGKSNSLILNRIIDGEYQMKDSKVALQDGEFYLLISYQFEKDMKRNNLDKDKILGIDMGIKNPVYMSVSVSPARTHISGTEIQQHRKMVEARRRELQEQGKYCGKGRRGHGRKKKLQPVEKFAKKIQNFRNTLNHKYAKHVVEYALKHRCGVIQLEDLTEISAKNKKSTFLGDWTYYDLQTKIEYKAKEQGIEVVKVSPKYTSQRCSECGVIDSESRPTQETFKCTSCGYTENADYNASRNLSIRDIDLIIKEQMEYQKELDEKKEKQLA